MALDLKIFSDNGLMILIWMTQLIVYPSFTYMQAENLLRWHPVYTQMITYIVMPLMLIQISTTAWLTVNDFNLIILIQLLSVLVIWGITFFVAVPLHNSIVEGNNLDKVSSRLVSTNWPRTVLWSLIFALNILQSYVTK